MPFEKGRLKTEGRQPGSINRTTTDIKARVANFINEQFAITDDMSLLELKERVTAYLKLMEYVVPKQREQKIDLSTLTDGQVDELLDKAMAKLS